MYRHLYVHVPFCARRCSYCDFAIAVRRQTPVAEFVASLRGELQARTPGRAATALDTLYLGGGTPSRLGGEGVAFALDVVREHFDLAPGSEVTVEANPEDVTPAVVRAWRGAGVNRVSLGVQSFSPEVLRWMHRTHDVAAIHRAAEALRIGGIANWSLDLIYALPPEVPRDWAADVGSALALEPPHISAYGLTVEPGTPLARWRTRGEIHEADEERYERDFLEAHDTMAQAGLEHYEVSNYARPGLRSRHNSSYWRNVPYLGVGPGAHGFDGASRRWNEREYSQWSERVSEGVDPRAGGETLDLTAQELERVYIGLRTLEGVKLRPNESSYVAPWIEAGWGTVREGRLMLTPRGWLRLDALVAALTEHRSRY
ncbi:MAG: radical SAM family heme chaperone HemW [Gemmatimonadaceae bacterium]